MAKGRKRKPGPRKKSGKLIPVADMGTERAQALQARFGTFCTDALGRAYVCGLLGNDGTAQAMLDIGRSMARIYRARYTVGRVRSSLGGQPHGGTVDDDRVLDEIRWLSGKLTAVRALGAGVRVSFEELVINGHADNGPPWLERILSDEAELADFGKLALALEGLEATVN